MDLGGERPYLPGGGGGVVVVDQIAIVQVLGNEELIQTSLPFPGAGSVHWCRLSLDPF